MTATVILQDLHYIDKENNHNKFYRIFQSEQHVALHWGPIGGRGSTKSEIYATEKEAVAAARRQLYSKMAKGYRKEREVSFEAGLHLLTNPDIPGLERAMRSSTHSKTAALDATSIPMLTKRVNDLISSVKNGKPEDYMETYLLTRNQWAAVQSEYQTAELLMEMLDMTFAPQGPS